MTQCNTSCTVFILYSSLANIKIVVGGSLVSSSLVRGKTKISNYIFYSLYTVDRIFGTCAVHMQKIIIPHEMYNYSFFNYYCKSLKETSVKTHTKLFSIAL